ncbi:MAG TPA: glycosyltransferase family 2 protein [Chloroflexota bacterium]
MLSISIVTPSLNQGQFIERTLRSVLDQQYPALEYVVCDGGSSDQTAAVVRPFERRVRVLTELDRGQSDAVNKGIRLTSGEIIGWLNSDDVYRPGALATVSRYFAEHPEVDVIYGDAELIDEQDQVLGRYPTEPWQPRRLVERCFLAQPAVFFRRRVVERHGLLDERLHYCMDYEFWLRLAAGGAVFARVDDVLAGSRTHPATKTLRDRRAVHDELNAMLKRRFGAVPASWLVNHAYTLTELSRAGGGGTRVPFVAQMALISLSLAWRWNRSLSKPLLADLGRRVWGATTNRLRGQPMAMTSPM